MALDRIFDTTRARHSFDQSLVNEHCLICGDPAAHKIAEECTPLVRKVRENLCCAHFSWIFGSCSLNPYDFPIQRAGVP
jgi:hypothetical protein